MIFVVLDAELEFFLAAADEIVVEVHAHQKTFDEISSSRRRLLLIVAVLELFSKDVNFPVKDSFPDLKKMRNWEFENALPDQKLSPKK